MIRCEVTPQELIDRIDQHKPGWLRRARSRTRAYEKARGYTGGAEFWGEIKEVYIALQHEKCAYCETKLQGAALASKVHEVEHFRPKSEVKAWPDRKRDYWKDFPTGIATGKPHAKGYYRLAYHPFNYAIACTRCNSTLKSSCFPIRGTRDVALADPSRGDAEKALLIYPVSNIDTNPAALIGFDGVLAVPRAAAGPEHERAVTTIWFFQLNHQDLTTRRAEMLGHLWNALELHRLTDAQGERRRAEAVIELACSPKGQFSACMSAFRELYDTDRDAALARAEYALSLL